MDKEILELKQKFNDIKKLGYVKSVRSGVTGIGATFEYLLGKQEENFELPDFKGIEMKTKRGYSNGNVTLFSAVPDGENFFETKRLKEEYGYPDEVLKNYKVLNTCVSAKEKIKVGINYQFKLEVDRISENVFLCIYDNNDRLLEKKVYWTFETLQEKLRRKMQVLALVSAWPTKRSGIEYYKYYKIEFYVLSSFSNFIKLIEKGIVKINFKIGIFRSGKRLGEMHDHGTGFTIKLSDISELYDRYR